MKRLYKNKEWLNDRYWADGWSQSKIAEYCLVSIGTIQKWYKKLGLSVRNSSEQHSGVRNAEYLDTPFREYGYLYKSYCEDKKSIRKIAKESGVSLRTIARWLKENKIQTRNQQESLKLKDMSGKNNPNWSGGSFCPICGESKYSSSIKCQVCYFDYLRSNPHLTPNFSGLMDIVSSLRSHIKSTWASKILARDNFTCRECGHCGNLNAHHIVPFSAIKDSLVSENFNLDLTLESDRLKFFNIAKSDSRLNDIDNGITLCKECHKAEHRRLNGIHANLTYIYKATVIRVIDPDTICLDVDLGFNLSTERVFRLYGINTPEMTRNKSRSSVKALYAYNLVNNLLVQGRSIFIKSYKPDKYGRWLCEIILHGKTLNDILIQNGLEVDYYGGEKL